MSGQGVKCHHLAAEQINHDSLKSTHCNMYGLVCLFGQGAINLQESRAIMIV
jgi:hypothetical protein